MIEQLPRYNATTNASPRVSLRFVIYQEGEWWFAHCLELDLVAEGKSPKESLRDVLGLCATQIDVAVEAGDLASIFRPAPPEYWRLFSLAVDFPTGRPPRSIASYEAREAVLAPVAACV